MSITLTIQLYSRPEKTFWNAVNDLQEQFPGIPLYEHPVQGVSYEEGTIQLRLNQVELTNEQRDWLHLTPFSARYIDSYRVEERVMSEQSWSNTEYALAFLQAHLEDLEDGVLDTHITLEAEQALVAVGEATMHFMALYRPEGSPHYDE